MICSICGGEVIWIGPLSTLEGTQCQTCGGLNCQTVDSADVYDDDDIECDLGEPMEPISMEPCDE